MTEAAPSLTDLAAELADAKSRADEASKVVREVQQRILAHPTVIAAVAAKGLGSVTLDKLVTITTSETRVWDQEALASMRSRVVDGWWPFKTEFKEVRVKSKMIEEDVPDLWAILSPALTIKPASTRVELKKA